MPNRILRDWTDSDKVNQLTPTAEVFFVRLIMKADDFGRFHADPRRLRSACYPLKDSIRDTDISRWLAECEKAGLIRCYDATGCRYLCIDNFGQRLRQMREKYPAPPADCPQLVSNTRAAFVSDSVSDSDSDSLRNVPCCYCGATEEQTGWAHEEDHFHPRCRGGESMGKDNLLTACHSCNAAKQGRLFNTVEDCKQWLHWRFWSSSRTRYVEHRKVAFGGVPPDAETVKRGAELHGATAAQPNNSKVLGTNPRNREKQWSEPAVSVVFEQMRREIGAHFKRPETQRWGYEDERMLAEICTSPTVIDEWHTILSHRSRVKEFQRQSLASLLANWAGELDKARNYQPPVERDRNGNAVRKYDLLMPKLPREMEGM